MVMLAPPNRGSFVASLFAPVLGQLSPPLRQLTTDETSFVNRLAEPRGIEFGVIAAARDHLVALSSTCLPSQADHIVAPGRHAAVLFQRDVVEQIVTFLGTGRFLETARRVCDVRSTLLAS